GFDRVHVVDPLLLALRGDLGLVRPVIELHLGDAGDRADLTEIQLHLLEMLAHADRLEKVERLAIRHRASFALSLTTPFALIPLPFAERKGLGTRAESLILGFARFHDRRER